MAYYGNLALRPEPKPHPQQPQKQARKSETVVRRRQIPIGEKLLYLLTVAVCALVAGMIIFQYAQIYQTNRHIQEMNRSYEQLTSQSKELQREVEKLSDPKKIIDEAKKLGYIQLDPKKNITIGESGHAVAMNTSK